MRRPTHPDHPASTPDNTTGDVPARDQRGGRDVEKVQRLFDMTGELLAAISLDGRFVLVNPAWEDALGWAIEELMAEPFLSRVHPDDLEETRALMLSSAQHAARLENFTNRLRHRDGSWRWLLWSARCDDGVWYAAATDVTDRMMLERQALHDPLTKLPNRLLLMDRAHQAVARLHRSHGLIAVLFIDLDRFKAVNDVMGHAVGDHLLISVSERLAAMMRDSDTIARMGGDEFVVLAEDLDSDAEALALAERVIAVVEEPIQAGSTEVAMLASVGVTVTHDPQARPDELLREADVAMYRAKRGGGHGLALFDERLRQEVTAALQIGERLRHALPRQELTLVYQPILPLAGGRAVGCEALVRWMPQDIGPSKLGEMLPAAFLPQAEESELIAQIGDWVLHEVAAQAATWHREGIAIPVSLNVSARELNESDLAERVRDALALARLPGRALCLEVSEEVVLRDPDRAAKALAAVKKLGVTVALDNFGAGQSSLSLARSLPLDMLKLDRTLIQGFERDSAKRAMVAATVALARQARLTVVAVGIETQRQLVVARELECPLGQGFLLHQPDSPERVRLRETPGTVTSAPWRPLVRLRGTNNNSR